MVSLVQEIFLHSDGKLQVQEIFLHSDGKPCALQVQEIVRDGKPCTLQVQENFLHSTSARKFPALYKCRKISCTCSARLSIAMQALVEHKAYQRYVGNSDCILMLEMP